MGTVRLATLPRDVWQAHEIRFAQALLTFDPLHQQPEAPAYPLYVALGRLVNYFVRDPFIALVTLTVIASAVAAWLVGRVASILLGSPWTGAAAATVVLLSPGLLVFGPLPNTESVALAFIAATFLFLVGAKPELLAVAAAAAIGVRPEIAPAMIIVFALGCAALPRWRRAIALFVTTLILLFGPLIETVGVANFREWVGPTGLFPRMNVDREIVLRFLAHPWGNKFMALPLLVLAGAGVFVAMRRQRTMAMPALLAFGAVHTAICIALASGSSGVRPVLPATLAVGFFAVAAVARWPMVAVLLAVSYAGASMIYTWPVLAERRGGAPPAVRAVRDAAQRSTPGAVLVADPDLAPFAVLAPGMRLITPERLDVEPIDATAVQALVHGRSTAPGARTFSWRSSDAYTKLTGEKYRVVSVVPQPPARRYAARHGVYAQESSPELAEWRWLSPQAELELPMLGFRSAELLLRLPHDAPIERNRVHVGGAVVEVGRGKSAGVVVPAAKSIAIRSERSFTPPDRRNLSVQLVGVQQR